MITILLVGEVTKRPGWLMFQAGSQCIFFRPTDEEIEAMQQAGQFTNRFLLGATVETLLFCYGLEVPDA